MRTPFLLSIDFLYYFSKLRYKDNNYNYKNIYIPYYIYYF